MSFIAPAISSIATRPPHILYTYSGVTHPTIAVKREQCQVYLSFAKCERFRQGQINGARTCFGLHEFADSYNKILHLSHIYDRLVKTLAIPLKELSHSFLNLDLMRPAKRMQFAYINEFTHSTIRFRGIKLHYTLKADSLHYQF